MDINNTCHWVRDVANTPILSCNSADIRAIEVTRSAISNLCQWVMDVGNASVYNCRGILVQYYDGWAYIIQLNQ